MIINNNALQFITPDWTVSRRIKAIVSTRQGGVSQAPYGSLNVGLHVNDRQSDVLANRNNILSTLNLPNEPVWLNQVHSTDIIKLDAHRQVDIPSCDGAYTEINNVVCAVMTADCLPLFLCNKAANKVAVIHVGWRGLANGIIENAIKLFDESASNVVAWAGPSIGFNCFEIGSEVRQQLQGPDHAYQKSENEGKFYADLYQLTGNRLKQLGVTNYSHSNDCTYTNEELFFSYRRDQITGRMVSLIWIE